MKQQGRLVICLRVRGFKFQHALVRAESLLSALRIVGPVFLIQPAQVEPCSRKTWLKLYRSAKESVERGLKFAYSGRKQRKRQFRSLWIVRIGAAAKLNGLSYNQFIHGLKKAGVELDRKILADLAVNDPAGFAGLASQAKTALA